MAKFPERLVTLCTLLGFQFCVTELQLLFVFSNVIGLFGKKISIPWPCLRRCTAEGLGQAMSMHTELS